MSGDWPPEWDDPEEEFPSGAEQQDAAAEARLAEVSAYLASVPAPALPDAVAARISVALAAESAARAGDGAQAAVSATGSRTTAGAGTTADGDGMLRPPPARAQLRRQRRVARGYPGSRSRTLMRATSVMAGLAVIAAIGFGISQAGGSMSSSSGPAAGYAAEAPAGSASSSSKAESSAAASSAAASSAAGSSSLQILVTASGTKYQATSLAVQVRARLSQTSNGATTVPGPSGTSPAPSAGASKTAAAGVTHAPAALRGCVLHLTGGQPPQLLDRATYEGKPAYVIASSSHVWVVGLGCTAANAELITSAPLGS